MRLRGTKILGLLACAAASSSARADDTGGLQDLLDQSIVSTASKTAESDAIAPAVSHVITAAEIRALGFTSVEDAVVFMAPELNTSYPVSIREGVSEIGARGVELRNAAQLLVLVDGHTLNEPYRGLSAVLGPAGMVPIELVDRIEVVTGPGSVLYGTNAIFGIVNVVTKDAAAFRGVRVGLEATTPMSMRPYVGAGAQFQIFGVDGEVTYEVQYYRRRDFTVDIPRVDFGADAVTGKLARFSSDPVGTGVWGGSRWRATDLDAGSGWLKMRLGEVTVRVGGLVAKKPLPLTTPNDFNGLAKESIHRVALDVAHQHVFSKIFQLSSRIYADSVDDSVILDASRAPVCPYADFGITCLVDNRYGVRWAGVEVQPQLDWFGNGRLVTLLGIDARGRAARAITDESDLVTHQPLTRSTGIVDRTDVTIGAYGQQTWRPTGWLALNGGARLDYDPRFDAVVSPRAAAAVEPWTGGNLKAIYSQAFRAPSLEESYFSHPLQVAPSSLRPERVYSGEIRLAQSIAGQRLSFGVFDMAFRDLIERHRLTPDEAQSYVDRGISQLPPQYDTRNLGHVEARGFTMGLDGAVADQAVRYGVSVTTTRTVASYGDRGSSAPLEGAPSVFGKAHVIVSLGARLPTLGLAARAVGSSIVQGVARGDVHAGTHSPPWLGLRVTASGEVPWVDGLSYRVAGDGTFGDTGPIVIGPNSTSTPSQPTPVLMPLQQMSVIVGLEQRF